MVVSGDRTAAGNVARLGARDHDILGLLQAHRVLTTPQIVTLTGRPERTVDYRLSRLRQRSLVDRTRPYAASGSAPFYWWLTRSGARLVEGTSPAPGKGAPNPLFLRHTAAIAGLYVALVDAGPAVGLTLVAWRRDDDAWEDWTNYHGPGRVRPDAYAEVRLGVDGAAGTAGAFVEVDFATMDQARLRAKATRHRRYCAETVWWDRHPCCPALLLVTTSEARVNRFLAGVERDRPRRSAYADENPTCYHELVAACAAVSCPEEAVAAPVWRRSVGDAPVTLAALLGPEVRQYRQLVARVEAARRQQEEHRRRSLVHQLHGHADAIAEAVGDDQAAAVIRYLFAGPLAAYNPREEWALAHLDLIEQTFTWWTQSNRKPGVPAPAEVMAGWRSLYQQCWLSQAEALLGQNEAVTRRDPRLRRPAAAVAAGGLAADRDLQPGDVLDGDRLHDEAMAEHEARRSAAVNAQLQALPLHRRVRADRAEVEAAYDTEHLHICPDCALPRNDDDPHSVYGRPLAPLACRGCGGALVRLVNAPGLPPALDESLAQIAARRERLGSRR